MKDPLDATDHIYAMDHNDRTRRSDMTDKYADLRQRVEQSKDCMIAPLWADLIHDLWAALQEREPVKRGLGPYSSRSADQRKP